MRCSPAEGRPLHEGVGWVKGWSGDLSRRGCQKAAVTERVAVRVEVLVLEGDKSEADGEDRERDSGGRWEREQRGRGRERDGSTGECFGGAVAEEEGVGMRDRYCTQED